MTPINQALQSSSISDLINPISTNQKKCPKHGSYTEKVYKRYTLGCPVCEREQQAQR